MLRLFLVCFSKSCKKFFQPAILLGFPPLYKLERSRKEDGVADWREIGARYVQQCLQTKLSGSAEPGDQVAVANAVAMWGKNKKGQLNQIPSQYTPHHIVY